MFSAVKLSNPAKRAKDSQVPERDRRRERNHYLLFLILPRPYDTAVRRDIRNISFYLNCAGVGFPG